MAALAGRGVTGRCCAAARPLGHCQVSHVGARAVRLSCRGALVTVTAPGEGLAPYGYEVGDPVTFARFRDEAAQSPDLVVETPTWPSVDLSLRRRRATPEGLAALTTALESLLATVDPLRGDLLSYGRSVTEALTNRAPLDHLVRLLVGAGPGATPTGDDILVGLHASLLLHGRVADHARLAAAVRPLLPRTTRVSQHLLLAAAEGLFASYVLDLADAAADPGLVRTALDRAQRTGAHTGLDTAFALVTAPSRWKDAA